jgi:hypothetical protein
LDKEKLESAMVLSPPLVDPKVQNANMLSLPSGYFACTVNSHVDVADYSDSILVASTNNYSDGLDHSLHNSKCVQKPMSTMHHVSFNSISNMHHVSGYSHSSTIEQIHMPMVNYHD